MSVLACRSGHVTTITLNRPEKRNAVDPDTAKALHRAFVDFERDPRARVAVLTGAGEAFCSGFDLKVLASGHRDWLEDLHFGERGGPPLGPMGPTRLHLSKPVIAAVNGAAVAGGMELALWCDFRVMEKQAYMGVYCRRWGVPLVDGGTVRLPRLVGPGRAMELILTGRRVDSDECLRIGLCEHVVPAGESPSFAAALAQEIARFPSACMLADRRSALTQAGVPIDEAMRAEFRSGIAALSAEGTQGAERFAKGHGRHGEFDDL